MAFLKPDSIFNFGGVTVKEYLLTKHNPNHIDMPSGSMAGSVYGITIHNTDWINVSSSTTPAEQYTRATVNGNMKTVRVHYYTDDVCSWQNLPLDKPGWHAADGNGNGNRHTIAIECIMSGKGTASDKKAEDNAARLAAVLLKKYGLGIDHLYTHTHWLNVRDGKKGTVDQLNTMHNSYKMCPAYILPHWAAFKAKVAKYMGTSSETTVPTQTNTSHLYRIRKNWADAKSQIGAYSNLESAKKACKVGYTVFNETGKTVYSNGSAASSAATNSKWQKGQAVTLYKNKTQLFANETTKTPSGYLYSGTYYLYDGVMCKNGRFRVTTRKDYVGKTPSGKYVTGFVSYDNFK